MIWNDSPDLATINFKEYSFEDLWICCFSDAAQAKIFDQKGSKKAEIRDQNWIQLWASGLKFQPITSSNDSLLGPTLIG
jgi:hypothetical protein